MSPRKRSVTDQHVIAAAARAALRHGTEHVRLTDVAPASGLAAPTLVQRFGSREGLLEAIGHHFTAEVTAAFDLPAGSELAALTIALSRLAILEHLRFFAARPGHA